MGRTNIGSMNINGIVEEYKVASGGSVTAGDFVKFVNAEISNDVDIELSDTANSGEIIKAVQLSENKVFVTHSYNNYIYGAIATINNNTVILGTEVQIATGSSLDVTAISDTNIFIVFENGSYLYGIVCSINNTTITIGTNTQISYKGSYSIYNIKSVLVSNNNIYITWLYYSSYYILYEIAVTISGTTITIGNENSVDSPIPYSKCYDYVKIDTSKILLLYYYNNDLKYIIKSISNTTISIVTNTTNITETIMASGGFILKLNSKNKLYMISRPNTGNIYVSIFTLSNNTLTLNAKNIQLTSISGGNCNLEGVLTRDNEIIVYFDDTNINLYAISAMINHDTLVIGNTVQLSNTTNSGYDTALIKLNKNKILAFHSNNTNYYLNYMINNITHCIKSLETNTDSILGIAKTTATASETSKVYIPNV